MSAWLTFLHSPDTEFITPVPNDLNLSNRLYKIEKEYNSI